ncbi:MAG: bifunctional DNA-formamidopyrimidine glycosylase/DNA-(apurinic or apyrimidinic site) lyase [Proteobacteria bacterium]|nr:MAG: bifunctional DNA-formamidopyrimidine glycosylase/DNA-(apurinic or apyrimidinic site) lyase [Pseudomonadota bacterium]
MPELPEVECLTLAVRSVLEGRTISEAQFHRSDLRWPIPTEDFTKFLVGSPVLRVRRRSKYMLVETEKGCGIFHLGMTGNLLLSDTRESKWKHTHASFQVKSDGMGQQKDFYLHFVDPRRFGCILACEATHIETHDLLRKLGPEPLDISPEELAEHLWQKSRGKSVAVKNFLMDAHMVVGVGNIYANESLFRAAVRPTRPAQRVKRLEWAKIALEIQKVLREAIAAGGTSFRDYKHADGEPGYFELRLLVYGREGEACRSCGTIIKHKKIGGRATFYCPHCQF